LYPSCLPCSMQACPPLAAAAGRTQVRRRMPSAQLQADAAAERERARGRVRKVCTALPPAASTSCGVPESLTPPRAGCGGRCVGAGAAWDGSKPAPPACSPELVSSSRAAEQASSPAPPTRLLRHRVYSLAAALRALDADGKRRGGGALLAPGSRGQDLACSSRRSEGWPAHADGELPLRRAAMLPSPPPLWAAGAAHRCGRPGSRLRDASLRRRRRRRSMQQVHTGRCRSDPPCTSPLPAPACCRNGKRAALPTRAPGPVLPQAWTACSGRLSAPLPIC
jgi:hypothetical protein